MSNVCECGKKGRAMCELRCEAYIEVKNEATERYAKRVQQCEDDHFELVEQTVKDYMKRIGK